MSCAFQPNHNLLVGRGNYALALLEIDTGRVSAKGRGALKGGTARFTTITLKVNLLKRVAT